VALWVDGMTRGLALTMWISGNETWIIVDGMDWWEWGVD